MTSDHRIAANRENAKKSTGPKSKDGKRRVSQNARRHGLSTPPDAEAVRAWFSIILDEPALEGHDLGFEGQSRAASLADAEARLQRVRDIEHRFLEDCHVLDRSDVHRVYRYEVVTTSYQRLNRTAPDKDGVLRPEKTKPVVIDREEKTEMIEYSDELRRISRYRREAECRRRRTLKEWISYLKRLQNSKTKPMEVGHAG